MLPLPFYFLLHVIGLRQGLFYIVLTDLKSGWTRIQRSVCLYLSSAGIKGVCHHAWLIFLYALMFCLMCVYVRVPDPLVLELQTIVRCHLGIGD